MFSCLRHWMPAAPTYYLSQCSSFFTCVAKHIIPGKLLISTAVYYKRLSQAASQKSSSNTLSGSLHITQDNIRQQVKKLYPLCILPLSIQSSNQDKDLNILPKLLAIKSLNKKYHESAVKVLASALQHQLNNISNELSGFPVHLHVQAPFSITEKSPRRLGDRYSSFTPTITMELPLISFRDVSGERKISPYLVNRIARDSFSLHHELATIAQGKDSICLAFNFSMGLLNLGLWAYGLSGTAPLVTQLISTTIKVASFHAVGSFFMFNYLKNKVLQADIAALDAIKCSSPAHGFLFGLKEEPHNLGMPSKAARIANVTHWEYHHSKSPS